MGQVKTSLSHRVSQYHRSRYTDIWREKKWCSLPPFSVPCPLLVTLKLFMHNSRKLLRKTLITWNRMKVSKSNALLAPQHSEAYGDTLVYTSTVCTLKDHKSSEESMSRVTPCPSASSPRCLLCHLSPSGITVTPAAAASTGTQPGCRFGGALEGNGQIQTCFTQRAWRSWIAEWAKVIHKKGVFRWACLFLKLGLLNIPVETDAHKFLHQAGLGHRLVT